MSQYILVESRKVLPNQTLRSFTQAEYDSPLEKTKLDACDKSIEKLYGTVNSTSEEWIQQRRRPGDGEQDESNNDDHNLSDVDKFDDFDVYINVEVLFTLRWECDEGS